MSRFKTCLSLLVLGGCALACSDELYARQVPGGYGGSGGSGGSPAPSGTHAGGFGGDPGAGGTSPSGGGGGSGAAGAMASAGAGGTALEPDFDSLPWNTAAEVGFGVARKDSQNPLGNNAFIGYGGYDVTLDEACAWTTALYHATLRSRGVRHLYCVKGPADPSYSTLEIGNSKLAAHLVTRVDATSTFVLVAAHSSGSFVAHEVLAQLANGLDPSEVTLDRVVYFDLDGGQSGLTATSVARLKRAYFVSARNAVTGTNAPNHASMQALGATYANKGGFLELDGSAAGCASGATWCMHMVPILTKPHNPNAADASLDYTDFLGRPVTTAYIEAKAIEAGLTP